MGGANVSIAPLEAALRRAAGEVKLPAAIVARRSEPLRLVESVEGKSLSALVKELLHVEGRHPHIVPWPRLWCPCRRRLT